MLDFRHRRKIPPLQKASGLQLRRCDPRVRDRATRPRGSTAFLGQTKLTSLIGSFEWPGQSMAFFFQLAIYLDPSRLTIALGILELGHRSCLHLSVPSPVSGVILTAY